MKHHATQLKNLGPGMMDTGDDLVFSGHLHVTDFGLAKRLKIGQRTATICGTLQYIGNGCDKKYIAMHCKCWQGSCSSFV